MAETTLHPRPDFSTFLQSDANGLRDSVTYYERQRALRFQKVAILQKKKENAYVPGYKKRPATVPTPTTIADRAENFSKFGRPRSATQNVTINPIPVEIEPQSKLLDASHGNNISQVFTASSAKLSLSNVSFNQCDSKVESNIKPIIINKQRSIKSATTHKGEEIEEDSTIPKQRPATVPEDFGQNKSKDGGIDLPSVSPIFKNADTKAVNGPTHEIGDKEADNLYKAYQWGTTTQRSYGDAGWEEKMNKTMKEQPKAGFRNLPDPVTYRLTYKRYNSEPSYWQSFGSNWDYIQPRRGDTYPKGPQSIIYQTTYPVMQQIPGYSGYSSALANFEFDQPVVPPRSVMRSVKPRYTNISRKANIPGYNGCVHWSNPNRAHANMPFPEPTTSARVHREIPLEDEVSPFRRDGILSRMVTTVPPNNPFRKIVY